MLIRIEDYDDISNLLVTGCFITKLYTVYSGKIAYGIEKREWHPQCFSLDIEETIQNIEKIGKIGKWWIMEEIPALAFIGKTLSLIVVELNPQKVLASHRYSHDCAPYIDQISERFVYPKGRILKYITDETSVKISDENYLRYTSKPEGNYIEEGFPEPHEKGYPELGWDPKKANPIDCTEMKNCENIFSDLS